MLFLSVVNLSLLLTSLIFWYRLSTVINTILFDLYLTFHTLGYCKLLCRKSKFQWLNTYLFYCFLEIGRRVSAGGNAEKSLNGGSKGNWKNRPAICLSLDCSLSYSWNDSSSTWKLSAMTKHQKGIVPIILLVDGSSISSFRKTDEKGFVMRSKS